MTKRHLYFLLIASLLAADISISCNTKYKIQNTVYQTHIYNLRKKEKTYTLIQKANKRKKEIKELICQVNIFIDRTFKLSLYELVFLIYVYNMYKYLFFN